MATGAFSPRVRDFLAWQASVHSEHRPVEEATRPGPFVTISREYGCEGYPLANKMAERLNGLSSKPTPWVVMNWEVIRTVAERSGVAGEFVDALTHSRRSSIQQTVETLLGSRPTEYQAYEALARSLLSLAEAGRVILLGRGGAIVCRDVPRGIHLRLIAPVSFRAVKMAEERKMSLSSAEAFVMREERARESFVREFTGEDVTDPNHYNIIFNNERHGVDDIADLTLLAMRAKGLV